MIAVLPHRKVEVEIRQAVESDRQHLANLVHFEMHVHRHLDWQSPLDWIDRQPFLVALQDGDLLAALACPVDPPGIAWIRLFATVNKIEMLDIWNLLWKQAAIYLASQPGCLVAAIPLQNWLIDLLAQSGFQHSNDVIILKWESGTRMPEPQVDGITIRAMVPEDLEVVQQVDAAAFRPLWRNSGDSLSMALAQATVATVAVVSSQTTSGGIVGYQISTSSHMGGHIARLAIDPRWQGRNIGYALVYDVLRQFERRMIFRATVNTQRDNTVSQSLYYKAGFRLTGESYTVYQTVVS